MITISKPGRGLWPPPSQSLNPERTPTMENMALTHKWEEMGYKLPYKLVGMYEVPSPSLAEHNPTAYNLALAAWPHGFPCGSCSVCGTPIKYNYLIVDAEGHKFVVGSECVFKLNDTKLVNAVKKAERDRVNKINRERAEARRKARREAWLEANKERLEREAAERAEREKIEAERKARQRQANQWIIDGIGYVYGYFAASICQELRDGRNPRTYSDRALDIIAQIYGKGFGRSGSKKYEAAVEEFWNKLEAMKGE